MSTYAPFIGGEERTTSDGRRIMARPATRERFRAANAPLAHKLRVAAYARVSTDHEEQQTSYEAQVDYYTRYITGNPEWEFAGMYADADVSYGQKPKGISYLVCVLDTVRERSRHPSRKQRHNLTSRVTLCNAMPCSKSRSCFP